MEKVRIPRDCELAYATLRAIGKRGGSVRTSELNEAVSEITGLTEEQLASVYIKTVQMQMGWARSGLKASGYLDNSQRGVWSLTQKSRALLELEPAAAKHLAKKVCDDGWDIRFDAKARRNSHS